MTHVLAWGGGFLVAVLWFDLMFDVQVRRLARPNPGEDILASIAAYYARVTGSPMGRLVGVVMTIVVAGTVYELIHGLIARPLSVLALACTAVPVGLALSRVLPNAMRLGRRADPIAEQSRLALSIWRDHLFCLAALLLFCAIQLLASP